MSKFTPGPWVIDLKRGKPFAVGPEGKDETSVFDIPLGNVFRAHVKGYEGEQLANACLISKAPEMYGLLKEMIIPNPKIITESQVREENAKYLQKIMDLLKEIDG